MTRLNVARIKSRVEARTGWLFGRLPQRSRPNLTDPVVAAGFTTTGSAGLEYRSGLYIDIAGRGVYLCRSDGLERGKARDFARMEAFANSEATR